MVSFKVFVQKKTGERPGPPCWYYPLGTSHGWFFSDFDSSDWQESAVISRTRGLREKVFQMNTSTRNSLCQFETIFRPFHRFLVGCWGPQQLEVTMLRPWIQILLLLTLKFLLPEFSTFGIKFCIFHSRVHFV